MTSLKLSIIIVSFNTCELLRKCLTSAYEAAQGIPTEIIVVDNASKDGSPEMLEKEFPQVVLVRSATNLGFGAGNNAGFKIAKGKYLLLLNSDAFMHEGALPLALKRLQANPTIGLVGARLVGQNGAWQPSARQSPSLLNAFLELSGLADRYPHSRFFGRYNRTYASAEESCEVDWVPGAFMLIPHAVIDKVGGFDERFFFYSEEVDLCRRIQKAGYQIWYWADVVVTHLEGGSSKGKNPKMELWYNRSMFIYYRKHHGWLGAFSLYTFLTGWHRFRILKNRQDSSKQKESQDNIARLNQAWKETEGGKVSPPKPW